MILVYIDEKYTDYLRSFDNRVSYNRNKTYQRPFVGVLFQIGETEYFAPLTSSTKGLKLKEYPKPENTTFYPILNCQLGGINFNNMIPVFKKVYWPVKLVSDKKDSIKTKKETIKYLKIVRFLRKNKVKIIQKAKKIYNLQSSGELFPNYEKVTCNFQLLEEKARLYK